MATHSTIVSTKEGPRPRNFSVEESEIPREECPVSFITQRSYDLVLLFVKAERVREETGASILGSSDRWPGWFADAADVIRIAKIQEINARQAFELAAMS